jgi:hypothetical protein
MQLSVLLVTDAMLFNSVTLRLGDMDQESFLSQPLYNYFVDGLAAIIPCPKENVFVFNIQVHTYINTMDTFSSCLSGCKKKTPKSIKKESSHVTYPLERKNTATRNFLLSIR